MHVWRLYSYIYKCFGIDTPDQFIRKCQDKFSNKLHVADTDWRELTFLFLIMSCLFIFVWFVVFSAIYVK